MRALKPVDINLLAPSLGGAISAVAAIDDGAHGAQAQRGLVNDPAQRLARPVQSENGGDLRLAGGERTTDIRRTGIEDRHRPVRAPDQIVVLVVQLRVLVPERLPRPALVGQHHAEGFLPTLQRGAVVVGVFAKAADQIAGVVQFASQFGDHAVTLPQLVAQPVRIMSVVVVDCFAMAEGLAVAVSKLKHFRHSENPCFTGFLCNREGRF